MKHHKTNVYVLASKRKDNKNIKIRGYILQLRRKRGNTVGRVGMLTNMNKMLNTHNI